MKTYKVTATREGAWWLLRVPELDVVTQARRLDQAEATARDLIAVWRDVRPDSFHVTVSAELDDDTQRAADEVKALQSTAARAAELASAAARQFAAQLLAAGYTVRDAGAILEVSPQRVSQLTAAKGPTVRKTLAKKPRGGDVVRIPTATSGRQVAAKPVKPLARGKTQS